MSYKWVSYLVLGPDPGAKKDRLMIYSNVPPHPEDTTVALVDNMFKSMNNREVTIAIFIDLSKAFDTVPKQTRTPRY